MYSVEFCNKARKEFNKMRKSGSDARKVKDIEEMIEFLEMNGPDMFLAGKTHPGWRPEELNSSKGKIYSFRISKGDRLTFEVLSDNTIVILGVKGHYTGVTLSTKIDDELIPFLETEEDDVEIQGMETVLSMMDLFYEGVITDQELLSISDIKHVKTSPISFETISDKDKAELMHLESLIESNSIHISNIIGFKLETSKYLTEYDLSDYIKSIKQFEELMDKSIDSTPKQM